MSPVQPRHRVFGPELEKVTPLLLRHVATVPVSWFFLVLPGERPHSSVAEYLFGKEETRVQLSLGAFL